MIFLDELALIGLRRMWAWMKTASANDWRAIFDSRYTDAEVEDHRLTLQDKGISFVKAFGTVADTEMMDNMVGVALGEEEEISTGFGYNHDKVRRVYTQTCVVNLDTFIVAPGYDAARGLEIVVRTIMFSLSTFFLREGCEGFKMSRAGNVRLEKELFPQRVVSAQRVIEWRFQQTQGYQTIPTAAPPAAKPVIVASSLVMVNAAVDAESRITTPLDSTLPGGIKSEES